MVIYDDGNIDTDEVFYQLLIESDSMKASKSNQFKWSLNQTRSVNNFACHIIFPTVNLKSQFFIAA